MHKLLGEESAGVNLVAEGEYESEEDEEWWVGTVRVEDMEEEEEEALEEIDESEPEREIRHGTSAFMRRTTLGWRTSSSISGKPTFLRTSQKKTDGGAQNPQSQVLKKMRTKSGGSPLSRRSPKA